MVHCACLTVIFLSPRKVKCVINSREVLYSFRVFPAKRVAMWPVTVTKNKSQFASSCASLSFVWPLWFLSYCSTVLKIPIHSQRDPPILGVGGVLQNRHNSWDWPSFWSPLLQLLITFLGNWTPTWIQYITPHYTLCLVMITMWDFPQPCPLQATAFQMKT